MAPLEAALAVSEAESDSDADVDALPEEGGKHGGRGGGAGGGADAAPPLPEESGGLRLHLSGRSASGYRGVTSRGGRYHVEVRHGGVRLRGAAGGHATAVAAAEEYARLRLERATREAAAAAAQQQQQQQPRLSVRMLEARASSWRAVADWDHITRGWQEMAEEAEQCKRYARLWQDPDFPHDNKSIDHPGHSSPASPVRWLHVKQILGRPHLWPDGRESFLFSYDYTDVSNAALPADAAQGSLGNCYFISAVAATMGDVSVRSDLIDESLEECGIYGVSFFVRGRWRMVWVDSYFPCVQRAEATGGGGGGGGSRCTRALWAARARRG